MPGIHIEIQGQSFDAVLPDAIVTVGSAETADLRIQGPGIAAQHCTLEPLHGGLHKIKDANSGNPTKVNGVSIKQVSLKEGDIIEIGPARIIYHVKGGEPVHVAEPAAAIPAQPAPAVPAPPPPPPPPPPKTTAKAAEMAAATPAPAKTASESLGLGNGNGNGNAKRERKRDDVAHARSNGSRQTKRKSSAGLAVALLVGIGVLVVIVMAVSGGSGGTDQATAQRDYDRAQRLYEEKDYEGARAIWKRLAADKSIGDVRHDASSGLQLIGDAEREMDTRLERLWSERLDLTTEGMGAARASFLRSFGSKQAARFDAQRDKILAAQAGWKKAQLEDVGAQSAAHVDSTKFNLAREVWRKLGRGAPPAIDLSADIDAGLAAIDKAAEETATNFLARAQRWIDEGLTHRARAYMRDVLPRFEGTSAYARMQKGLENAQAAYDKPVELGPSVEPGPATAQPEAPAAPTTEEGRKALEDRARASLAKLDEPRKARRFADAALALEADVATYPAGDVRKRLSATVVDLRLAETGMERLIAHINENPQSYLNVKFNKRLYVNLMRADRDRLTAVVRGGRSTWDWKRVPQAAFTSLVRRMKAGKDDALAAAALLQGVGLTEHADMALFAAGEKGVDTRDIFPMLARWRGEAVPEGGYVVYDKRYVTPARREFLIREAKIEAALKLVNDRDSEVRAKAYHELLQIGEPAAARYTKALEARRKVLIDQIVKSRSFTGGKYKSKLLGLLDKRRKHALVLIYDAKAYPYPNPRKLGQKEVEERVDKVREIWERPFDLVAQWDKKLGEKLKLVTEVDEALADASDGYTPDLDVIKDRINKAIDIPSSADPGKREYSLKVLAYNETLETTATEQEKDNTRIVNEYRMMMGLLAVKIEERILRAARGHSRHMAKHGYFAHNVPAPHATPQNRTPGARAKQQGFGSGVGENIARGPGTGRGAFWAWFGSSGHHRNMLGRGWLQMGCGRANGSWWTQLFAGGSKSLKQPDPYPAPSPEVAPDPENERRPIREIPQGEPQVPDDEEVPGDQGLPGQGDDPGDNPGDGGE